MTEKVQDWKDWNGIKWEEGDFILAERMNLLQDNVQSLKDTIDIHNLLVENSDGTWNIAETRDVIMNVLTVAPSYDDLQFPVNEGDYCWHEGSLYCANTDIATAEAWTAAHWDIKPIGDDVIAAYERIDEIQKSAEIQTLGSLENRVGVLENNTVNKWESFPANTVIPEGTYCIYENKIYYAINDFTKTSSGDDSNPSSSHFCIEVANTTVRPKKIQIDDSAIETKIYGLNKGKITKIESGYAKIIHIDKTELYNHGKIIYITTTNHSGSFFAAALLNINPLDNSYSYLDPETEEENIVNFVIGDTNIIVSDTIDRETQKYRKLDITESDAAAQEKIRPAEITNNFYLLLYYGNNSSARPNEPSREEILKDISIYYGAGTTQEQLDDLSARIDTTALENSIEGIRNQIGTSETDKTLWQAIETNQNNISSNSQDIENNADEITAINNKIGTMEDTTPLVERINAKASQDVVDGLVGRVENLESTSSDLDNNVSALTTTVQEIQTSIDTTGGKNLENTFAGQFGENTDYSTIWELLKAKINSGDYSQIHVEDYVPIRARINDYVYTINMTVAGIDLYTGISGTLNNNTKTIGHHIDFIGDKLWYHPTEANNGAQRMYSSADNTYERSNTNRWNSSILYSYLNQTNFPASHPVSVLNLPINLISNKYGYISKYQSSTSYFNVNTGVAWINFGKLWIPNETEITGFCDLGGRYESCASQYPLFKLKRGFFSNQKSNAGVINNVTQQFFTLTALRDSEFHAIFYDSQGMSYSVGERSDSGDNFVTINIKTLMANSIGANVYLNFPICFRIEADS